MHRLPGLPGQVLCRALFLYTSENCVYFAAFAIEYKGIWGAKRSRAEYCPNFPLRLVKK
jgi:hypothetical protein